MAQFIITVQDAHLPRVIAAFTARATAAFPTTPVVVDKAWIEQYIKTHLRDVVRATEQAQAYQQATAAVQLPGDIS